MPDKARVIKSLKALYARYPWYDEPGTDAELRSNQIHLTTFEAFTLLETQPLRPNVVNKNGIDCFYCGECNHPILHFYRFCPACGTPVKTEDIKNGYAGIEM